MTVSRKIQVGPCTMPWIDQENIAVQNDESNINGNINPCLKPLIDSSHLLHVQDPQKSLLEKFNQDGYLFIRGLLDRETVLGAKKFVLEDMEKRGNILDTHNHDINEGVLLSRCGLGCVPYLEGRNNITHHPLVQNVLENSKLREFFEKYFFGQPALTFDFKWLRVMPRQKFTGVHVDNVYMSRGSKNLITTWIPIGDTSMEMGTVAVCEGSHKLSSGFKKFQETYGEFDTEAQDGYEGTGWFTEDPSEITQKFGGQWRSADFQAGDVLLFGMRTAHMSTRNMTDKARISCDVRWQPASEPVDQRYVGKLEEKPKKFGGAYASDEKKPDQSQEVVTMTDLKNIWGI